MNIKINPVRAYDNILLFDVIEETMGFGERIHQAAQQYVINKQELIEDYIYKNLETSVLQAMKLKIENELMSRKLKEQTNDKRRRNCILQSKCN